MTEYAEAAVACGDPAFAEPLHRLLEPWADHFSTAGGLTAEGPVRLVLGGLETALGRYDAAERDFALAERSARGSTLASSVPAPRSCGGRC